MSEGLISSSRLSLSESRFSASGFRGIGPRAPRKHRSGHIGAPSLGGKSLCSSADLFVKGQVRRDAETAGLVFSWKFREKKENPEGAEQERGSAVAG